MYTTQRNKRKVLKLMKSNCRSIKRSDDTKKSQGNIPKKDVRASKITKKKVNLRGIRYGL